MCGEAVKAQCGRHLAVEVQYHQSTHDIQI